MRSSVIALFSALALAAGAALCTAQEMDAENIGTENIGTENIGTENIGADGSGEGGDDWSNSGGDWGDDDWGSGGWEVRGFAELAYGEFTGGNDAVDRDATLQEVRLRLETSHYFGDLFASLKADLLSDRVVDEDKIRLRETYLHYSFSSAELRAGRQILTWGTGDLLFLNDLFPKNWPSFFNGRDLEYLKAPSDAVKFTWFNKALNLDLVWTPEFDSDTFINGERFSYFDPAAADPVAAPPVLSGREPGHSFDDGELALRLFKTLGGYELGFYGYRGYFKQPRGFDPGVGRPYFPRLNVYGASLRGPVAGGIGNLEFAWRDSRDDSEGRNPLVPNAEYRYLLGYERELVTNLTLGLQYYLEWTADYERLIAASPTPAFEQSERRHTVTTRLTWRTRNDKLIWSLFAFYSPDEKDSLAMPNIEYRHSDELSFAAGFNLFTAEASHTFLGRFEQNSNAFVRVRYRF